MRSQGRATGSRRRIAPVHAALATAILGLLVMPFAFAGARSPEAQTSASAKAQLKSLKKRVAALESRVSATPSGPAGGDLTGVYPNPQIGPNAVGAQEIADNAIRPDDVSPNSLGQNQIATLGVGIAELAQGAVTSFAVGDGQIRAGDLGPVMIVQSPATVVGPGTTVDVTATCPVGWRVLSGGPEWAATGRNDTSIMSSAASFNDPTRTWEVQGRVNTGGTQNTLFAEALCLSP
jgi:hypothetical protein